MSGYRSKQRGLGRVGGLVAAALLLGLAACSSDEPPAYVEKPVEELYNGALNAMQAGEYDEAARLFDEVERQHHYSEWAAKAQIMAAYALYQATSSDAAIIAPARFIKTQPDSPHQHTHYKLKANTNPRQ